MKDIVLLYGEPCKLIMCGFMYSGYLGNKIQSFSVPLWTLEDVYAIA